MTRTEFIQWYVLLLNMRHDDKLTVRDAIQVADSIEGTGVAPWDDAVAQRTVEAAVRTEREACAKLCEHYMQRVADLAGPDDVNEGNAVARHVAAGLAFAIRARR
jgi:hypothetical protein